MTEEVRHRYGAGNNLLEENAEHVTPRSCDASATYSVDRVPTFL